MVRGAPIPAARPKTTEGLVGGDLNQSTTQRGPATTPGPWNAHLRSRVSAIHQRKLRGQKNAQLQRTWWTAPARPCAPPYQRMDSLESHLAFHRPHIRWGRSPLYRPLRHRLGIMHAFRGPLQRRPGHPPRSSPPGIAEALVAPPSACSSPAIPAVLACNRFSHDIDRWRPLRNGSWSSPASCKDRCGGLMVSDFAC